MPAGDTTTTVAAVPQGAEEPYVTEVESCTNRPPAAPLASGTLTNNTDESSSYDIWVDFTDASGAVVATGMSSADSVDPGETVSWEAVSIDLGAVATGCDVSRVEPW